MSNIWVTQYVYQSRREVLFVHHVGFRLSHYLERQLLELSFVTHVKTLGTANGPVTMLDYKPEPYLRDAEAIAKVNQLVSRYAETRDLQFSNH
jgi:hypothetical protein